MVLDKRMILTDIRKLHQCVHWSKLASIIQHPAPHIISCQSVPISFPTLNGCLSSTIVNSII